MALDCVFRLLHRLHHTDSRQNFLCKRNQQNTEQAENTLRSLRRVVGLHGHTELHNAPAEDDNADRLDAGKNEVGQVIYDGQRIAVSSERRGRKQCRSAQGLSRRP